MLSEVDVATTFKTCSHSGPVGGAPEVLPLDTHTHPREQLRPPSENSDGQLWVYLSDRRDLLDRDLSALCP